MKIVLGIVGVLLVLFGGVAVAAMMQPDHLHVERQIEIEAQAVDMTPYAIDVKKINTWSPWDELDPNMKQEFSDPTSGLGAWYSWEGNDEVGAGKATISKVEPGKVVTALEFYAPMEGVADASIAYKGDGNTLTVVWSLDQKMGFADKAFSLFMDFDKLIGDAYIKGLGMLKPMVEKDALARVAEEKRLAEQAEAKRVAEEKAKAEVEATETETETKEK